MKIAIATDGPRVSTVFDFTDTLAIVETENGIAIKREEINHLEHIDSLRVARLKSLEIDVLICGAISEAAAMMIRHCGIRLVPGITGGVEIVVNACIRGELNQPHYLLPGFEGAGRG